MVGHDDISEFLLSRRAKLTPDDVGLPDFGGRRRVAGLRREEVAMVAGISPEYYKRIERGNVRGVSESVLDGISRALKLDDAEHAHLYDLVRTAQAGLHPQRRLPARKQHVSVSLRQTIDAMSTVPVFVQNGRLDAIATNPLGRALFSPMFGEASPMDAPATVNAARYIFLHASAQDFYRDWEANTRQIVALLRAEAGRAPYDHLLSDLIGELSLKSDLFRKLWGAHDVREHRTGIKRVHHPVVGDLDLTYQTLDLATDRGLQMLVFSAAPATASHVGLRLLSNWAATQLAELPHQPLPHR